MGGPHWIGWTVIIVPVAAFWAGVAVLYASRP